MRACITVMLLLLAVTGASAQGVPSDPTPVHPLGNNGIVVAVNPLGFLQFGPTIEAEIPAGKAGLAFTYRRHSLGLITHVLDEDIESGWMVGFSPRFYKDAERRPAGWFFGPRVEWGKSDSGTFTSTIYGGAAEAGYRWLFDSGFTTSVGLGSGYFSSSSENKPGYNDDIASLKGAFIMGVVNIGLRIK